MAWSARHSHRCTAPADGGFRPSKALLCIAGKALTNIPELLVRVDRCYLHLSQFACTQKRVGLVARAIVGIMWYFCALWNRGSLLNLPK
jgi:hypothetical protein